MQDTDVSTIIYFIPRFYYDSIEYLPLCVLGFLSVSAVHSRRGGRRSAAEGGRPGAVEVHPVRTTAGILSVSSISECMYVCVTVCARETVWWWWWW